MKTSALWGAVAALALAAVACGDDFSADGSGGSSSSSGTGGTATGTHTDTDGGAGGTGGTVTTSSGTAGGAPAGCGTTPPGGDAIFHVTFDSPAETAVPAIGDGNGFEPGGGVDTAAGLIGDALRVDSPGEYVSYLELGGDGANLDTKQGTLDFCFKPNFSSHDDANFVIFRATTPTDGMLQLRKASLVNANNLQMTAVGNLVSETQFAPEDVALTAGTWVRVTISWDFNPGTNVRQVRLWLDGAEIEPVPGAPTGSFPMGTSVAGQRFYVGGSEDGTTTALGLYDELVVYPTAIQP